MPDGLFEISAYKIFGIAQYKLTEDQLFGEVFGS